MLDSRSWEIVLLCFSPCATFYVPYTPLRLLSFIYPSYNLVKKIFIFETIWHNVWKHCFSFAWKRGRNFPFFLSAAVPHWKAFGMELLLTLSEAARKNWSSCQSCANKISSLTPPSITPQLGKGSCRSVVWIKISFRSLAATTIPHWRRFRFLLLVTSSVF